MREVGGTWAKKRTYCANNSIREKRGMPWRKKYDPSLSFEEKGQRAYEVSIYSVVRQEISS